MITAPQGTQHTLDLITFGTRDRWGLTHVCGALGARAMLRFA